MLARMSRTMTSTTAQEYPDKRSIASPLKHNGAQGAVAGACASARARPRVHVYIIQVIVIMSGISSATIKCRLQNTEYIYTTRKQYV